jgi:hypothetical protein
MAFPKELLEQPFYGWVESARIYYQPVSTGFTSQL